MLLQNLDWQEPLKIANKINLSDYKEDWIFLFSGLSQFQSNSKSYLALYPKKEVRADIFEKLEENLQDNSIWLGYLGYDLKNNLENLPYDQEFKIKLPNLWLIKFAVLLEFNHDNKEIICFYEDKSYCEKILGLISRKTSTKSLKKSKITIKNLQSNFSKKQYLSKVDFIKNKIAKGDLYQANLTRKFFGKIKAENKFQIFADICKKSPANYSSFMKLGENYVISSSPELFLEISENGLAKSSPIKGTKPRSKDIKLDEKNKNILQNSPKERAENLMIVDLTRNDLSKSCEVGSIKVENIFNVTSYKTLHHMSSDIIGVKKSKISNLELIKNCFPPASMTGTPKIKAMEICSELEKVKRGIYSGAIGIISDKFCKLSVVIRTIIIQGENFEFQVGGAITFGSKSNEEWQETVNKSKGIAKTLGIKISDIKKL